MKVKPAPGVHLRDPVTMQFISDEGQEVDDNDLYWVRRINDGDAVRVDATASAAEAPENAK